MKNRKRAAGIIGGIIIAGLLITGCASKPAVMAERNLANLEKKDVTDFYDILEGYRNGILANLTAEGLRTQIITFSFAEGNRAYFCTTSDKPMYSQLLEYPDVSYCTYPEDWEPVLSLNGKVVFIEDRDLKERALDTNYYAKRNFGSIDNPLLRVFCINVEVIETYSNDGVRIYAAK